MVVLEGSLLQPHDGGRWRMNGHRRDLRGRRWGHQELGRAPLGLGLGEPVGDGSCRTVGTAMSQAHLPGLEPCLSPGAKGLLPWEPQFPHLENKTRLFWLPEYRRALPDSPSTRQVSHRWGGPRAPSRRVARPATDPAAVGLPSPGQEVRPRGHVTCPGPLSRMG